ncbi:MAG: 50S ribosomal protein L4 [Planctomycetes bacterium]|nr:50S ribosomal protein L4 [Planctomycetota bacterium]
MVEVKNYSVASGKVGSKQIDEKPFGRVLARSLKNAVVMYEAHLRQGTVQTKERGEIAGTTKKPWKQKHTGRARAGSKKSPLWRGGGTIFGPHPRSYDWRMPRKMRQAALRAALAGKIASGAVSLVEGLTFDTPKAKVARKLLADLNASNSCLVVLHQADETVYKSFRNFPRVRVREAKDLNAYDVCFYRHVLATAEALEQLRERVGLSAEKLGA